MDKTEPTCNPNEGETNDIKVSFRAMGIYLMELNYITVVSSAFV